MGKIHWNCENRVHHEKVRMFVGTIHWNCENRIYHEKVRMTVGYYTLDLPVLLYGSETWSIKASDARIITAAEIKYMRRTAG